ncbi:MAG: hypothetical protein QXP38_13590 [Nitrososphaerota archaeon]
MNKEIARSRLIQALEASGLIIREEQVDQLVDAAWNSEEIHKGLSNEDLMDWINQLIYGSVILTEKDYTYALIQALNVSMNLRATDYGTSRQRDLGQLWTDTTRGFLGERAFSKFLFDRFQIVSKFNYQIDTEIDKFLSSDLEEIVLDNGTNIKPRINLSIKTTKLNGMWLDVPGAQIRHSDYFVLIKLGTTRYHFVSFLKWISAIRDKLLKLALSDGILDEDKAQDLYDKLPNFECIPCFIYGFIEKQRFETNNENDCKTRLVRSKNSTRPKIMVIQYIGEINGNKPSKFHSPDRDNVDYEYQSIGKFSQGKHYISSINFLEHNWSSLLEKMINGQQ